MAAIARPVGVAVSTPSRKTCNVIRRSPRSAMMRVSSARRRGPRGPKGQVVVCSSDESLGSMTFVSSPAPGVISMRRGLALAATGRVTVSTPF